MCHCAAASKQFTADARHVRTTSSGHGASQTRIRKNTSSSAASCLPDWLLPSAQSWRIGRCRRGRNWLITSETPYHGRQSTSSRGTCTSPKFGLLATPITSSPSKLDWWFGITTFPYTFSNTLLILLPNKVWISRTKCGNFELNAPKCVW